MAITGFKDLVARDKQAIFLNEDEHADPVTYTVKGGAPESISAIVNIESGNIEEKQHHRKFGFAFIDKDDITGVAGTGDTLELDSELFEVVMVVAEHFGGILQLEIETDVRPDYN